MVSLVIPVLNGGQIFAECLAAIDRQDIRFDRKIVMESGSQDNSRALALAHGFEVHDVPQGTFNHGGTRSRAAAMLDDDIILFLTQDAFLDDVESAAKLIKPFQDPNVAAVFGRQLPHRDANKLAIHARQTSYRPDTYVTSLDAGHPVGIRKCFLSNSFAAYRRSALQQIGGFPSDVIACEDMYVAAKLLKSGWKIAYAADARARHSHNYTVSEEFRRYFDTGVFHDQESWILDDFGRPESEGISVAFDQIRFLAKQGAWAMIPRSIISSGAKFIGYKLGLRHAALGRGMSRRLAMHRRYFAD